MNCVHTRYRHVKTCFVALKQHQENPQIMPNQILDKVYINDIIIKRIISQN